MKYFTISPYPLSKQRDDDIEEKDKENFPEMDESNNPDEKTITEHTTLTASTPAMGTEGHHNTAQTDPLGVSQNTTNAGDTR